MTLTGSINGSYACNFDAQTGAVLSDAPSTAQSFASTMVSGAGDVLAGSAFAFADNPLVINGGNLVLSGNNLSFTNLNDYGAGGKIVNGGADAAALTVATPTGQTDSYGGTLADGGGGSLGLQMTGGGQLVLTGPNTSTGGATIPDNTGGTLQIGDGSTNGQFGGGTYDIGSGGRLYLDYATAVPGGSGTWSNQIVGGGTLELNSAQPDNATAQWGPNTPNSQVFSDDFTGALQIDNGRIDASPGKSDDPGGPDGLGGVKNIVIDSGAQFLAWSGTYSQSITIAGDGWGESDYPGALRAAPGDTTWAGDITLADDATIMSQEGASFTLAGAISGDYQCTFDAQAGATLTDAPSNGQNSYGLTEICDGGTVIAGNSSAFSAGPLSVDSGTLELDGNSFAFAGLGGAGGQIVNGGASPATLTIATPAGQTDVYGGTLADGGSASLGLTVDGPGMAELAGVNTFSGGTTLAGGALDLANASALQNSTLVTAAGGGDLVFDSSVAGGVFTLGGLAGDGDIALQDNATDPDLVVLTIGNNNADTTYAGVLSGPGGITKIGTGVLTLSGQNTFTGPIDIGGGTLQTGSDSALPATAVVQVGDQNLSSGVLDLNGWDQAIAGLSTDTAGAANNIFDDVVTSNASTLATLTIDNAVDYDYQGVFAGNLAIDKYGVGTLTVEGANTNTGAMAVYDGTLQNLGSFTVTPSTEPGSGNPQITSQPSATDWIVGPTSLVTGQTDWTDSSGSLAPSGDGATVANSWQQAVLQALSGTVSDPNNGNAPFAFPGAYDAATNTYADVTIVTPSTPASAWEATPFLMGTVGVLDNWVTKNGTAPFVLAPGQYGITSWNEPVIVMEDEFGLSNCDYDYNDDYLPLTATSMSAAATVTALDASSTSSVYDQSVTLTATVSATNSDQTPTGSVTFYDGTTPLDNGTAVPLTSGVASVAVCLPAGAHDITATYSPDDLLDFAASTSQTIVETVSPKPLYWDPEGVSGLDIATGAGLGGDGTWDAGADAPWYDPSTATDVPWDNSGNVEAVFAVAPGTVTVESAINVASIQVLADSYAIVPDSGNPGTASLALPAAGGSIDVETGTVQIDPNLSSPGDLEKLGGGMAALGGDNAIGGTVDIQNGTVQLDSDGALGNAAVEVSAAGVLDVNGHALTTAGLSGLGVVTNGGASGWNSVTTTQTAVTSFDGSIVSSDPQSGELALIQQTPGSVSMPGDATAVTLSTVAAPATYGDQASFTATVSDTTDPSSTPTGTIALFEGTTYLASQSLADGADSVSFTGVSLSGGTNSLRAVYLGDGDFATSTSPPVSVSLAQQQTTTSVTVSIPTSSMVNGEPVYGAPITLAATVSPANGGSPTGTVEFWDGAVDLGPGYLEDGSATLSVSSLMVGGNAITAVYQGDANFAGSDSPAVNQAVAQAGTTTTLASSPNPSVTDQPIELTATVHVTDPGSGAPTGVVEFWSDGTDLGGASLNASGIATLVVSDLGTGNYDDITAAYGGDANFTASTSTPIDQVVNQAATATYLSSSANPAVWGQPIDLIAIVVAAAPGGGTPSGEVVFYDGSEPIGSATLDGNGDAILNTSDLVLGNQEITAVYQGDANDQGSTSAAVDQFVTQTTTTLDSSSNPAILGQPVTLTANVAVVTSGGIAPTGYVAFYNGSTELGESGLGNDGSATFTTSDLGAGDNYITATYLGDSNYLGSTSATLDQFVTQTATTLTSSPNPAASGQQVTFTASVSVVTAGGGTPTGNVAFYDGSSYLGDAALNSNQVATLPVASMSGGDHSIMAVYEGDANFAASVSNVLDESVSGPMYNNLVRAMSSNSPGAIVGVQTLVGLTASQSSVNTGQSFELTASVSKTGKTVTTGYIWFYEVVQGTDGWDFSDIPGLPCNYFLVNSSGEASVFLSESSPGLHQYAAVWTSSKQSSGNMSDPYGETGVTVSGLGSSTTAVTAWPPTISANGNVTITATVTSGKTPVTSGSVTIDGETSNGAELGPWTLALDNNGQASEPNVGPLPAGVNVFTATYSGNAQYSSSNGCLVLDVSGSTTVALGASPANPTPNQPVTLTATVTCGGVAVTGGTVTFTNVVTDQNLGTVNVVGGTCSLDIGTLTYGQQYEFIASYSGSTNYPAAESSPFWVTVSDPPPTVSQAATATPNAIQATSSSEQIPVQLNVLGKDQAGQPLTYTWTASCPSGVTVSFPTNNGSSTANNLTATVTGISTTGNIVFTVTISGPGGTCTSQVTVSVELTFTPCRYRRWPPTARRTCRTPASSTRPATPW